MCVVMDRWCYCDGPEHLPMVQCIDCKDVSQLAQLRSNHRNIRTIRLLRSYFRALTPHPPLGCSCAQWYHPSCIHEGYDFARDEFDQGEDYLCQHCLHKRTSARHANTHPFKCSPVVLRCVLWWCSGPGFPVALPVQVARHPARLHGLRRGEATRALHPSLPQWSGPSFYFLVRRTCL